MAEKKEPTVLLAGKTYKLTENFPAELLKKNYSGQDYIPVEMIREVMRQVGGFSSPKFSDLEIIGKSVYKGNDIVVYKQKVTLSYNDKELYGEAYHPVSAGKLFSDSSTGVFSTLRSKCLRDALKYEFRIFEYPDGEGEDTMGVEDNTDAKKIETPSKIVNTKEKEAVKVATEKTERQKTIEDYNATIAEIATNLEKDATLKDDVRVLFENMKTELAKLELVPEEKKILMDNWKKLDALLK